MLAERPSPRVPGQIPLRALSTLKRLLWTAALMAGPSAAQASLDAVVQTRLDAGLRCHLGVYTLPAQKTMTITGSNGQARALRYTLSSGQFGDLQEAANGSWTSGSLVLRFEPCSTGRLRLSQGQVVEQAQRLQLIEKTTTFTSDGVPLHGKLVLPAGGRARALAVWIEGSNNNPSTDDSIWPYALASRGVATLVYDKRGTGSSGGAQLSDFHARARDTAAAVREARRLVPGIRQVGVIGGSQGGWVAPLTATLVPLDFVVAAFALAEGPIAQDQALVAQQLREAGFDAVVPTQAKELTSITERIVRSNLREGLAELDAFKARWASAPWLDAIEPRSFTGLFLKFSSADILAHGATMAQGLSFDYEPRPVIETIQARQLWLLGGSDRQAPSASTQTILKAIQQQRPDVEVLVFPKAGHGLIEPISTPDGPAMAYSARLFDLTAAWIQYKSIQASAGLARIPPAP